ncbi:MAG: hypothetical protein KKB20_19145 [Proteobacteria bacterium]|nr:hypothetical protein [Pseudomonadota bacterium]
MNKRTRPVVSVLTLAALFLTISAGAAWAGASLTLAPDKTVLSPALIKQPIVVTGAGWQPGEVVVINLIPPKGVIIQGADAGEPVGIANGVADDQGNLKTTVEALTVLMTFFQVGWDDAKAKPDFSQAKPLPPGSYPIEAVGTLSDLKAGATLTLEPPPQKK